MHAPTKIAVALTAMSIAAASGGISPAGAQAQNEALQASATTISSRSWSGWCFRGAASATFTSTGPATGPYPGTFTETNANLSVSRPSLASNRLTLSIPFTIISGTTTITGSITNPPPYSGGSLLCWSGSFFDGGPNAAAGAATYTATIQTEGQPAQTTSGTAQFSASFRFQPILQVSMPTATLLNFPSP